EVFILVCVSLALAYIFLPGSFLVVVSSSLLLGVIYSIGPVRLKKRPFLDILANAAGSGILNTLAGWLASGGQGDDFIVLLPYPLAVSAVHLASTLADLEGDRRTGLRTTGVLLGRGPSMTVATILMAAAAGAAFLTSNKPALYASLLSLPFFLLPLGGRKPVGRARDPLLPAKASTVMFCVAAGFYFPLFIPFVAVVVVLTRVYYSRRFSLKYPSI
ncbi:MAG TPA: UbiA family prenyltransferase, partial [Candidatus Krumholzibacterium sp.]|nr:UbiA family prenyltransferase [Candidatus Krumholzibacterium sp.]